MKSLKYILIPFVLVGFLWSCETTDPFVDEIQTYLMLGTYDEAIAEAERQLDADSSNGVAHYYRALAIGSKAQEIEEPSERKPLYEDTRSSLTDAKHFMEQRESLPGEYDDIDELTTTFWAYEHNSGIEYLTEDSVRNSVDTPDQFAMAHFENAITIQPDSALSYIVLSSTQFNTGDINSSISTYERAMEKLDQPEVEDYEFLISLYINQEMFEKAQPLTQEAMDTYPENDQFIQFLADIYIQQGNVDEAISIIESLIEADPENPQYYRVLGTQIYQSVGEINDRISQLYDQVFDIERDMRGLTGVEREAKAQELEEIQLEIDELEAESNELTEIAIEQMNEVTNLEPEDPDAYNILGIIYQNWAALIFEKRNSIVDDNQLAQELDEEARETLQQAKQYYEKAAELNPEVSEYWESLFQVYTTLGMEEEAREAMEKADSAQQ